MPLTGPPPPVNGTAGSSRDVPLCSIKVPVDVYGRMHVVETRRGERKMRRAWDRDVKRRYRVKRRAYRKRYPWSVRHRLAGKVLFAAMVVVTLAFFVLA